jgi:hypothetical protein
MMRVTKSSILFLLCWIAGPTISSAQPSVASEEAKTPAENAPPVSASSEPDHSEVSESVVSEKEENAKQKTSDTQSAPAPTKTAEQQNAVSPQKPASPKPPAPPATAPLSTTKTSQEQEPAKPRFGDTEQLTINGSTDFSISGSNYSSSDASGFRFDITPSFDYFVLPHFSIGGFISIAYSTSKYYQTSSTYGSELQKSDATSVSVGPRLGYDIPFLDMLSWFITIGFSYGNVIRNTSTADGYHLWNTSENIIAMSVYAPILVHLAPHFYVGFGPSLYTELSHSYGADSKSNTKQTTFGASLIVGGWL